MNTGNVESRYEEETKEKNKKAKKKTVEMQIANNVCQMNTQRSSTLNELQLQLQLIERNPNEVNKLKFS